MSYTSEQYQMEKAQGKRLPNGAKPRKKLSAKHMAVIKAYLKGYGQSDIARRMSMTPSTVSLIINDPLAQAIISRAKSGWEDEFDMLAGLHVDALRDGLTSHDVRHRLQAASIYGRQKEEKVKREQSGSGESAEDVIQRMLQLNIQVNVSPKEKSVDALTYPDDIPEDE